MQSRVFGERSVAISPEVRIPDHELLGEIARGSYGTVWLARSALGTLRAVKIVRASEFQDIRPYEREFEGIRKFEPISRTHEGFVDILQVGRDDAQGFFYYVMELADNISAPVEAEMTRLDSSSAENSQSLVTSTSTYEPRTLASEMQLRGALPLDECIQVGLTLASALAELHRHNLVHRDIKPSNIIFVRGVPKLADIGLVAHSNESRSFVGTEGFIPPEGPGSHAADIYSLGIVLYVMVSGNSHYQFPEPPANLATRPDRERWLEVQAIIHRACQAEPRHRYESTTQMHEDLVLLQRGRSVRKRQKAKYWYSMAKRAAAGAILLAVITGIVYPGFLNPRRKASSASTSASERALEAGTTNQGAYNLSLEGREARHHGPEGLKRATDLFERAVKLDPNFTNGWGRLFGCYMSTRGDDARKKARAVADKLNELNPISAEALLSKAWLAYRDFDFKTADAEFQRALIADPNSASTHEIYGGLFLVEQGRLAEALEHLNKSQNLDSGNWLVHRFKGHCSFLARDFTNALSLYNKALGLATLDEEGHWFVGRTHEAVGDYEKAVDVFEKFRYLSTTSTKSSNEIAEAYKEFRSAVQASGWTYKGYWSARLRLQRLLYTEEESLYSYAALHARLGEKKKAFELLERARHQKSPGLDFLILDAHWDELRKEPAFTNILKQIGYRTDWPPK